MKKKIGTIGGFLLNAVLAASIGCSGGGGKGGNTAASSSSKEITSFEITSPVTAIGVIDESAKTIMVTVPYGTTVTSLVAKFVTTGVKTSIDSVEQISSSTVNDFTSTKNYTVTAQDGSTQTYTVTVTIAKSDAKVITKFEIPAQISSSISGTSIAVTMLYGTNVTALSPMVIITGASVSPASGAARDFTNPVDYTVTAADGSTQTYTVTVTIAKSDAKDITKFEIPAQISSSISGTSIAVTMLYGTNVTALSPAVIITGASVSPASGAVRDFTKPVDYTVTAADGSTKKYTATVTLAAASTVNTLTSLVLSNGTISPAFASGTDSYTASVDVAASSITVTPTLADATASVKVNTVTVASGSASGAITLSVGSNTITIEVISQSGAVKTYTVVINKPIGITTTGSGIAAKTTYTFLSGTVMSEIQATADTLSSSITFPMGAADSSTGTISTPFVMAETDVTYQLWKEVYDWATNAARGTNVYSIANPGQNGSDGKNGYIGFTTTGSQQYPVTKVNWRDAMVWCNAITEFYNANNGSGVDLAVVYCSDAGYSTPIRTSTNSTTITYTTYGSQDAPYVNSSAKGFRLPLSMEYEFAARYIGTKTPSNTNVVLRDGVYYTNGASVSGATATYSDATATGLVAVYLVGSTAVVKQKLANALGLYDMSGNLWKWNFEWASLGSSRLNRGGAFDESADRARIGFTSSGYPDNAAMYVGFRFARSK